MTRERSFSSVLRTNTASLPIATPSILSPNSTPGFPGPASQAETVISVGTPGGVNGDPVQPSPRPPRRARSCNTAFASSLGLRRVRDEGPSARVHGAPFEDLHGRATRGSFAWSHPLRIRPQVANAISMPPPDKLCPLSQEQTIQSPWYDPARTAVKIVHAADLHLDSPLSGLERYPGAPLSSDIRRALK
jgi:hypothetical protein